MKARFVFLAIAVAAASSILFSCTAGGGSIYATIEAERRVVDSTLPKTLTVGDVAPAGTGTYYVASGTLFRGKLPSVGTGVQWEPNTSDATAPFNPRTSPGNEVALCNTLAYYPTTGTLWGGFFTIGSNLGLYQSDTSFTFTSAVTDPAVIGKQVTLIQPLNGKLFVVFLSTDALSNSIYELYYFDGSTWNPALTGRAAAEAIRPITGIGFDGTSYWVTSGSVVYSGTTLPLSATSSTTLGANTIDQSLATLTSVSTDEARNRVFITVENSGSYQTTMIGLYYKDSGGAWAAVPAVGISSVPVGNLAVSGRPVDSAADKYLVGSDGYSYFTLSVSAAAATPTTALTRFSDNTIGLYTAAVRKILVDPDGTVFMGTAGTGLWRATFDATGAPIANGTLGSTWVHE